jgi:hypothetical protein
MRLSIVTVVDGIFRGDSIILFDYGISYVFRKISLQKEGRPGCIKGQISRKHLILLALSSVATTIKSEASKRWCLTCQRCQTQTPQ